MSCFHLLLISGFYYLILFFLCLLFIVISLVSLFHFSLFYALSPLLMHSCIFYISIFSFSPLPSSGSRLYFYSFLVGFRLSFLFSCHLFKSIQYIFPFLYLYCFFCSCLLIFCLQFCPPFVLFIFTFFSILTHSVLCFVSFLFLFVALVPCLISLLHCSVLL